MNTNLGKWMFAAAACGVVLAGGVPARGYDDGSSATSLTIVPIGTSGDTTPNGAAPVKPKKKITTRAAAKSPDAGATIATTASAEPAAQAAAPSAPAATAGAPPSDAPSVTTATSGTAIQPLDPIALPTPEPSQLSASTVWPRPDAERRAAAAERSAASSFGVGRPIGLTQTLTRGGATLGAMLMMGGLALVWARSRRGKAASADPTRDRLTVVSSRALAPRRSLHLVEVDGVRILVGLDAEHIVPLALVPPPPRAADVTATAPAKGAARAAAKPAAVAAAPAQRPAAAPAPAAPLIDEKNPVTVDVPDLLARAARSSATRAPDPAALLSLTNSLKRHLRNRANGNGGGNGHGSIA